MWRCYRIPGPGARIARSNKTAPLPPSSRHRKVYTIRDRALVGANLNSASTRTSKLSVSRQANALELMLPLTRSLQLPAASVQSKNKRTSGVRSIFTNSVVGCGRKLFTEIGDTSLKWTVKCIFEAALDYSVCRPVCVCRGLKPSDKRSGGAAHNGDGSITMTLLRMYLCPVLRIIISVLQYLLLFDMLSNHSVSTWTPPARNHCAEYKTDSHAWFYSYSVV